MKAHVEAFFFFNNVKLAEKLQEQYREYPDSDSPTVNISLHFLLFISFFKPFESSLKM